MTHVDAAILLGIKIPMLVCVLLAIWKIGKEGICPGEANRTRSTGVTDYDLTED